MFNFPISKYSSPEEYKIGFIADASRLNIYAEKTHSIDELIEASVAVGITLEKKEGEDLIQGSAFENLTPAQIHDLCVRYWSLLPDSPTIHIPFFIELCQYCSEWDNWSMLVENVPGEEALDDEGLIEVE